MGNNTNVSYKAWVYGIQEFEKANPKYKADMVSMTYGDVNTKLPTVVAAGTPPNVAEQDRYTIAGGAARGLMQDISAYAKTAGITGNDQQPWCWREVALQGKLYGLPFTTDSRMVFVNVNHVTRAGIATTAPKTLDMPPITTIVNARMDVGTSNTSGLMNPYSCASNEPARPEIKAPTAKASDL